MLDKIRFKNYKSFEDEQELELKPITVLIGKNSSGKTAVAKLLTLIDGSLSGEFSEAFSYDNNGVILGDDFRDVFYKREAGELEIHLANSNLKTGLEVKIILPNGHSNNATPLITYFRFDDFSIQYDPTASKEFKANTYKDGKGEYYQPNFKGFKPSYEEFKMYEKAAKELFTAFQMPVSYIGPLRVQAEEMRYFTLPSKRDFNNVGLSGKNAYYILALEFLKLQSDLIDNLNDWYSKVFGGWKLKSAKSDSPFEIHLYKDQPEFFSINLADVGQGMSQTLPLIISAFLPKAGSLTIIEQPELHLHPSAHGDLAELFARTAKDYNKKYLLETHSKNFVLRLRRKVAEKKLNKDDLALYYVNFDEATNSSSLKKINVDELGRVDFWPENIFSETLDETIAIRTAQINAERKGS